MIRYYLYIVACAFMFMFMLCAMEQILKTKANPIRSAGYKYNGRRILHDMLNVNIPLKAQK